jgi:hypothetical protein
MRWQWVCSFSRYCDLDYWGRANHPAYQLLNLAATPATYRPGYSASIPRFSSFLSPALFDSDRRQTIESWALRVPRCSARALVAAAARQTTWSRLSLCETCFGPLLPVLFSSHGGSRRALAPADRLLSYARTRLTLSGRWASIQGPSVLVDISTSLEGFSVYHATTHAAFYFLQQLEHSLSRYLKHISKACLSLATVSPSLKQGTIRTRAVIDKASHSDGLGALL